MTIDYADLNFALTDRSLVVSYPAGNIECRCELNDTCDRIQRTWVTGFDTPGTRYVAELMRSAGNSYLDGLRLVETL